MGHSPEAVISRSPATARRTTAATGFAEHVKPIDIDELDVAVHRLANANAEPGA
jgi:hypothetical protein